MSITLHYPPGITVDEETKKRTEKFFREISSAFPIERTLISLVSKGICLGARNKDGRTPLLAAAVPSLIADDLAGIVNPLLAHGANIEAQDKDGLTVLATSAFYGSTPIAEVLLEHGADTGARDKVGKTALMWAASNDKSGTAGVLLEHGMNIEARDKDGKTALMWAASNVQRETVNFLLERGANLYARAKDDIRPIDIIKTRIGNVSGSMEEGRNKYPTLDKEEQKIYDFGGNQKLYTRFYKDHMPPKDAKELYALLAFTPLRDDRAQVDFTANLRSIYAHADWKKVPGKDGKQHAIDLLGELEHNGSISAAEYDSILNTTFPEPPARHTTRYLRQPKMEAAR